MIYSTVINTVHTVINQKYANQSYSICTYFFLFSGEASVWINNWHVFPLLQNSYSSTEGEGRVRYWRRAWSHSHYIFQTLKSSYFYVGFWISAFALAAGAWLHPTCNWRQVTEGVIMDSGSTYDCDWLVLNNMTSYVFTLYFCTGCLIWVLFCGWN